MDTIIDTAIESRIHVKLHYSPLTHEKRHIIWKHLLHSYQIPLSDSEIAQLAVFDINNREIVNTIHLALIDVQDDRSQVNIALLLKFINMRFHNADINSPVC
jgi:hypothetical protein